MPHRSLFLCLGLMVCLAAAGGTARGQAATAPREVVVLPVFFVPQGQPAPTLAQSERLTGHLRWARDRYRELLRGQATFGVAEGGPHVYRAQHDLAYYRSQEGGGASQYVAELLQDRKTDRYSCPYVFVVVVMNPADDFPGGGGRPLNGGINTGGGHVQLSSYSLDRSPNFQSTLQHELGHAFGLPHVDVYGYDMGHNRSLMSYNPGHHTAGFEPSSTPGELIPEDLRALSLNRRVLPGFEFDLAKDLPRGYSLQKKITTVGPMEIAGQPAGPTFATDSGEAYRSRVVNLSGGRIGANRADDGPVTYDPATMWHSAESATGRVAATIEFPLAVSLTRVVVHSQHSGRYHIARGAKLSVRDDAGHFRPVAEGDLAGADAGLDFPAARGKTWRLELRAGESRAVVLRGLEYFHGDDQLFPPSVPYRP